MRARWAAFALLFGVPLALATAGQVHAAAVVLAGASVGAWFARRFSHANPKVVVAIGIAAGAAAVVAGFAIHLSTPRDAMPERGVLFMAVSAGAWMLAASASAWFVSARGRLAARSSAVDDRISYGLTLALCAALAYGFIAADGSEQFRVTALIAACGLASALGVRMMTGAPHTVAAPASLWRIPEERLVAACVGEIFDAACIETGAGSARHRLYRRGVQRGQRRSIHDAEGCTADL